VGGSTSEKTKKVRVSAVIGIVLCIILIPILIINLTLIIKSFVYPDKVPGFFGYKPFIVLSGSMEPEFYTGDIVLVKEVPADTLAIGDVIAFRLNNSVVTHRIIEVNNTDGTREFFTKGDNNNTEDNIAITYDMVEGKYLFAVSGLGNFALFLQTPVGMLLFIAVPLIAFILYDILRRRHYYLREKELNKKMEEELARMRQQLESVKSEGIDTAE
jgi:signal peptidase